MDLTSPFALIFTNLIYIFYRLNDIQKDFCFIFFLLASDNALHRGHQHQFVLEGVRWFLLHHSIECIAHDSNEHVQERDLGDERRGDEQSPEQSCRNMRLESICLELSKH